MFTGGPKTIHTPDIMKSLHDHKQLKILDLSNNNITQFKYIGDFLAHNNVLQKLVLTGNILNMVEDFRYLLYGMINNISVTELDYDVSAELINDHGEKVLFKSQDRALVNNQLENNKIINEKGVGIHAIQNSMNLVNRRMVSMADIMLPDQKIKIEAIIKYYTCQTSIYLKNELILRNCKIDN